MFVRTSNKLRRMEPCAHFWCVYRLHSIVEEKGEHNKRITRRKDLQRGNLTVFEEPRDLRGNSLGAKTEGQARHEVIF